MKRELYFSAAVLVVAIFVTHVLAQLFYWYSAIYGFDKVMHLFGGIFLAFLVAAICTRLVSLPYHVLILRLLLWVFIIGFGWELFEYTVQFFLKAVHLAGPIDSVGDLFFDVLGGLIGASFVILQKKRYNTRNG